MLGDVWPYPSGPRRPSVRVGFPWLAGFCAWAAVGGLAIDHPALRRPGPVSWMVWMAVGALALPAVVALGSILVAVALDGRAWVLAVCASAVATALARAVLFPDFAAFVVLGGFAVPLVATTAYVLATAHGLEAERDASGR